MYIFSSSSLRLEMYGRIIPFCCAFINFNSGVLMNSFYITLFDDLPSFNIYINFDPVQYFYFHVVFSIFFLLVYCSKSI